MEYSGAFGVSVTFRMVGHPDSDNVLVLDPSLLLSEVRDRLTVHEPYHFLKRDRHLTAQQESSTSVSDILPKLFTGAVPTNPMFQYDNVDYVELPLKFGTIEAKVLCAAIVFLLPDGWPDVTPGFDFIPFSFDIGLPNFTGNSTEDLFHYATEGKKNELLQSYAYPMNLHTGPNIPPCDCRGRTPLHYAAECGNLECCHDLLNLFGNDCVNIEDYGGSTALHLALSWNRVQITALLINRGASLYHSLQVASGKSGIEMLMLWKDSDLLELAQLIDFHTLPFEDALPVVKILIVSSVAKENSNILHTVIPNNLLCPLVNIQDELGWTPLHHAANTGNLEIVQCLLEKGGDPSIQCKQRRVPLNAALRHSNADLLSLLLHDSIPDINMREAVEHALWKKNLEFLCLLLQHRPTVCSEPFIKRCLIAAFEQDYHFWKNSIKFVDDDSGVLQNHLLPQAAYCGDCASVDHLLTKNRIDVNLPDLLGNTPLHYASLNGHVNVVNSLLKIPAINPNIQNTNGETALHCACRAGHLDTLSTLLDDHRVDGKLRDSCGRNALLSALHRNRVHVGEHLISHFSRKLEMSAMDSFGYTVLHYAFRLSRNSVLRILDLTDGTFGFKHRCFPPVGAQKNSSVTCTTKEYVNMQIYASGLHPVSNTISSVKRRKAFLFKDKHILCPVCFGKLCIHRQCRWNCYQHIFHSKCSNHLSSAQKTKLEHLSCRRNRTDVTSHNQEVSGMIMSNTQMESEHISIKRHQKVYYQCVQCSHVQQEIIKSCRRCGHTTSECPDGFKKVVVKPFHFHKLIEPCKPLSPFHLAVVTSNPETFQTLYSSSSDLNVTDCFGRTPFDLAVQLLDPFLVDCVLRLDLELRQGWHASSSSGLTDLLKQCILASNYSPNENQERSRFQIVKHILDNGNGQSRISQDNVDRSFPNQKDILEAEEAVHIWKKLDEKLTISASEVRSISPLAVASLKGDQRCVSLLLEHGQKGPDLAAITMAVLQGEPEIMYLLLKYCPNIPVDIGQIILSHACRSPKRNLQTVKALVQNCPGLLDQTLFPNSTTKIAKVQFKKDWCEVNDVTNNTLLERLMASTLFCRSSTISRSWSEYQEAKATLEDFGSWLIEAGLHLGEMELEDGSDRIVIHGMCAALPAALKGKYWRIAQSLLENGAGEMVWKCGTCDPPSSCQLSLGLSLEELIHLAADRDAPDTILRHLVKAGYGLQQSNQLGPGRCSVDAAMMYWILGGKEHLVAQLDPDRLVLPFSDCNPVDRAILMALSTTLMFDQNMCTTNTSPKRHRQKLRHRHRQRRGSPRRVWIRQGMLRKNVASRELDRYRCKKVLTRQISAETALNMIEHTEKNTSVFKSSLNCRQLSKLLILLELRPQLAEKLSWGSFHLAKHSLVSKTWWGCGSLEKSDIEVCLSLLRLGQMSHYHDTTPLHEACLLGDINLVKKLLQSVLAEEMMSKDCCASPLEIAVWKCDREIVTLLIQQGAKVDDGVLGACSGYMKSVSWSMRVQGTFDGRVDPINPDDRVQLLNLLIERCPLVERDPEVLSDALFGACWHGNFQLFQQLVHLGAAQPSILQKKSGDLMNAAINGGHEMIAQHLVEFYVEANLPEICTGEQLQQRILVVAARLEMWKIVECLLNRFLSKENMEVSTPFLFARDKYGCTLLHYASKHGRTDIVRMILGYIEGIGEKEWKHPQTTACPCEFVVPIRKGRKCQNVAAELKSSASSTCPKCFLNATGGGYKTALWYALAFKQWDSAVLLLMYGGDVYTSKSPVLPCLPSSIHFHGHPLTSMSLALAITKITLATSSTPLHVACGLGERLFAKELIEYRPHLINGVDRCGRTPLYYASANNQFECAKLLIENGVQVGTTPNPVIVALACMASAKMKNFYVPPLEVNSAKSHKVFPPGKDPLGLKLEYALGCLGTYNRKVKQHVLTLIKDQIKEDQDIKFIGHQDHSKDQTTEECILKLLRLLCSSFKDCQLVVSEKQGQLVALVGYILSTECYKMLRSLNPSIDTMWMTVPGLEVSCPNIPAVLNVADVMLCFAPDSSNTPIAGSLTEVCLTLVKDHPTPENAFHPLDMSLASRKGYFELVSELIVQFSPSADSSEFRTTYCLTAVYACRAGKIDIIRSIAQLAQSDGFVIMMLNLCMQFGQSSVAKCFLETENHNPLKRFTDLDKTFIEDAGIRRRLCPPIGWTVLHSACTHGQVEILDLIKSLISLSGRRFEDVLPPMLAVELHFVAAAYGSVSVLQWLVEGHSFDLSSVNSMQLDPGYPCQLRTIDVTSLLHTSVMNNHEETALYLISQGIKLLECNKDGQNAYHLACIYGHNGLVRAMLHGCLQGWEEKDSYGLLPSDYARAMGHLQIADILTPYASENTLGIPLNGKVNYIGSLRFCLENWKELETRLGNKCWSYLRPNISTGSMVPDLFTRISLGCDALAVCMVTALLGNENVLFSTNKMGQNALHLAAKYGCLGTLSKLIGYLEKDTKKLYTYVNQKDQCGFTPVAYASLSNHKECESLLNANISGILREHQEFVDLAKAFDEKHVDANNRFIDQECELKEMPEKRKYLRRRIPTVEYPLSKRKRVNSCQPDLQLDQNATERDGQFVEEERPNVDEQSEESRETVQKRQYLRKKPSKLTYPVLKRKKVKSPFQPEYTDLETMDMLTGTRKADMKTDMDIDSVMQIYSGIYPPPIDDLDNLSRLRCHVENVIIPLVTGHVFESLKLELIIEVDWASFNTTDENMNCILDALYYDDESMIGLAGLGTTLYRCIYIFDDLARNFGFRWLMSIQEKMKKLKKVTIIHDQNLGLGQDQEKKSDNSPEVSEWRFNVENGVVHYDQRQLSWWTILHSSRLLAEDLQIHLGGLHLKHTGDRVRKRRIPVAVKWPEMMQQMSEKKLPSVVHGPLRLVVDDIVRVFVEYGNIERILQAIQLVVVEEESMLFHEVSPLDADQVVLVVGVYIYQKNDELLWDYERVGLSKSISQLERKNNSSHSKTKIMEKSVTQDIERAKRVIEERFGFEIEVLYKPQMFICACQGSCTHPLQCWAKMVQPILKNLPYTLGNAITSYIDHLKIPAVRQCVNHKKSLLGTKLQFWIQSSDVKDQSNTISLTLAKDKQRLMVSMEQNQNKEDNCVSLGTWWPGSSAIASEGNNIHWISFNQKLYRLHHGALYSQALSSLPSCIEFVCQEEELDVKSDHLVVALEQFAHQPLRSLDLQLPVNQGKMKELLGIIPHVSQMERVLLDLHSVSRYQTLMLDVDYESFLGLGPVYGACTILEGLEIFKSALHLFLHRSAKHSTSLVHDPSCTNNGNPDLKKQLEKAIKSQICIVAMKSAEVSRVPADGQENGVWKADLLGNQVIRMTCVLGVQQNACQVVEGLDSILEKVCKVEMASLMKEQILHFTSAVQDFTRQHSQNIELCFQEGDNVFDVNEMGSLLWSTFITLKLCLHRALKSLCAAIKFLAKNSKKFCVSMQQSIHKICITLKPTSTVSTADQVTSYGSVLYVPLCTLVSDNLSMAPGSTSSLAETLLGAVLHEQGEEEYSVRAAACPATCLLNTIDQTMPLLIRENETSHFDLQMKNMYGDPIDTDMSEHITVKCSSAIAKARHNPGAPSCDVLSFEVKDDHKLPKVTTASVKIMGEHISGSPFPVCVLPSGGNIQKLHTLVGKQIELVLFHENSHPLVEHCTQVSSPCSTCNPLMKNKWKSKLPDFIGTQFVWHNFLKQGWKSMISTPVEILYCRLPTVHDAGESFVSFTEEDNVREKNVRRLHTRPFQHVTVRALGYGCYSVSAEPMRSGDYCIRARCSSCHKPLALIAGGCSQVQELSINVTRSKVDPARTVIIDLAGKVLNENLKKPLKFQMEVDEKKQILVQFYDKERECVTSDLIGDQLKVGLCSNFVHLEQSTTYEKHVAISIRDPERGIYDIKIQNLTKSGMYWVQITDDNGYCYIPKDSMAVDILPGPVDASQCRASGAGVHAVRSSFQESFKVTLADKYGNRISSVREYKRHLTVESHTGGSVDYLDWHVREEDEALLVTYTTSVWDVLTIHVKMKGEHIHGSPFTVSVKRSSFENRYRDFRLQLKKMRIERTGLQLHLTRDSVFEDTLHAFTTHAHLENALLCQVEIRFAGELGMDLGGLTREWYQILSKAIFNPNYALFQPCDQNLYRPNADSDVQPDHLTMFQFVGTLIAKAMFDGENVDVHLAPSVYRNLLDMPMQLVDLQAEDETLHRNLSQLREQSTEDLESLCLVFAIDEDKFGKHVSVPLKEGGQNIDVTVENLEEYIELYSTYMLSGRIREQLQAFRFGFGRLIPQTLVRQFSPKELEDIICGQTEIKIKMLKMYTVYDASVSKASILVQWFWEVLQEFDQTQRSHFIQFVTGNSRLPIYMRDWRIVIGETSGSVNRLPTASTCFHMLKLPKYTKKEQLKLKLTKAITLGTQGFGLT